MCTRLSALRKHWYNVEPTALKSSTNVLTNFLNRDTTNDFTSGVRIPDSRSLKHTLPCSDQSQCQRERAHQLFKACASAGRPLVHVGLKITEDTCQSCTVSQCQLPGMNSVSRKVRFESVQLSGIVLHVGMTVQL